jgi:hypothetical protein
MERRGPIRNREGMGRTAEARELALELGDLRAHAPPPRADDGEHCPLDLVVN